MKDSIHTIYQSAKHFFSGTLLSRISGMLRDMSMAYIFGTHPSIASFMLAFRFAHLFRRLLGEGALQSAFIPEFEALRYQSPEKAFGFFRDLYATLTLFLVSFIILGCLGLNTLLIYQPLEKEHQEILFLTILMLPSLLFICLYGLNTSLLQCERKFFISGVAPVAFNGIWILAVLILKQIPTSTQKRMSYLALTIILACFCQWWMTVPQVLRILRCHLPSIWKDIRFYSSDMIKIGRPLFLGVLGIAAFQINTAMDSVFAHYADPEGPALLWYAIRLEQIPLALFGIALSGAILPPLSRAIKALDWSAYRHFLQYALKQTLSLMIPLTCALLAVGDTCINLIYGRGDFTNHSIIGTTHCLGAYALGLLPNTLILILAPACYAQNDYRLPACTSFLTMILNFFLNMWMIKGLGFGAVSVALATSISSWINLLLLGWVLYWRNGPLISSSLIPHLIKISFASLLAFLGTLTLRYLIQDFFFLDLFKKEMIFFPKHILQQGWSFCYQVGSFGFLFGVSSLLLNIFSLKQLAPALAVNPKFR